MKNQNSMGFLMNGHGCALFIKNGVYQVYWYMSLIVALRGTQSKEDLCEFKGSLVYKMRSRLATMRSCHKTKQMSVHEPWVLASCRFIPALRNSITVKLLILLEKKYVDTYTESDISTEFWVAS